MADGKALFHQLLGLVVQGEGLSGAAMDVAAELVQQQYQHQPAFGSFPPVEVVAFGRSADMLLLSSRPNQKVRMSSYSAIGRVSGGGGLSFAGALLA